MKRILFPTDFSEASLNAFKYALELADTLQAEIVVMHSYEPQSFNSARLSPRDIDEYKSRIEQKELDNLNSHFADFENIAKEVNCTNVSYSFSLEYGFLVQTIQRLVKEENYYLIVMGTSNDRSIEATLLGSNTYKVIVGTDVPVLCVPKLTKFKKIEKMAFSTMFSPAEKTSLLYFLGIAEKNNSKVTCVYVDNKNRELDNVIQAWKTSFDNKHLDLIVLSGSNPVQEVVDYIEKENIDLITTVKHNRKFFESIFSSNFTKKIANRIEIPLLVLHG